MAQDAELKLKVSLDLAFFRQQISTIGTQLAGQGIDLGAKLDKDDVVKQYNSLAKTLESKTLKVKVESTTLDTLVIKAANLKKSLEELGGRKISLSVEIADNIDELRKSIKSKLPAIKIGTSLEEPVNVDDFIRDVAKKVKDQTERSYVAGGIPIATKLALPGIAEPLSALQKNLNRQDPLRAKVGTTPSIKKADVTAFQNAVNEKFKDIAVKVKAELGTVGGGKTKAQIEQEALAGWQRIQQMGAERMGGVSEAARRESLRQSLAGRDIGELKGIGAQLGVAGVGRYKKTETLIEKIVADASIEMIKKYLDPQAVMRNPDRSGLNKVLDTFARGLFNILGMDVASMRQQVNQRRALPGVNFPATVPPRLGVPIGPSETGRALPAGRAAAGLIGAAQAPAGLLPSATRQSGLILGLEALIQSLVSQTQKRGPEGHGAIVSMETGFIPAMRERFAKAAERYLFGVETQVLDLFDAALRQVESAVDLHIAKIQGQISQRLRSTLSVVDLGVRGRPMLSGAAAGQPPLMLPPAGGTTQRGQMRFNAVSGGYNVPAPLEARPFYMAPQFASTTRRIPGSAGRMARGTAKPKMVGQEIPQGPSGGGPEEAAFVKAAQNALKFGLATDIAKKSVDNFRASQLPLIGGLKEVAGEFGFALKQVLLFGTAYKGLAFVQSLPGQILNAAKSQQQYNNALQTATQDTGTFAKELLYVDNVQRAFGLNLETTRSGFTKLYASMAPTGFDSGSIEKLFTGISAATAALQLTPDKAERVIYAFGQMASKGQIMSEELKGQLGDVLPGALAIFAKAAGMSVQEFSKAMEDGEFVGSKFRDTFAKVADELMKRFGTGAQAAGKSLQGLLNTVQGDFQRTLESFAPLANAAAQAILGPLGGSLKQLSMSAQIATGEIERTFMQLKEAQKDLGDLRAGGADAGDIKAAEQNVAALTARYKTLQQAAKDPAIAKQAQDIQSFTQELAKAGTFVMNTAKAIGSILSPILNLLGTNLTTVISLVTSFYIGFQTARLAAMALMGVLLAYRTLSTILGFGPAALSANALAGAFNTLGVAATGATVKTVGLTAALRVFAGTTILGIVAGIVAISGAFATMRDRAKEAAQSSRDAAKAAVDAAASGNVAGAQMSLGNILAQSRADKKALETLRNLRSKSTVLQREGGFSVALKPEESAALQGSELTKGMIGGVKDGQRQMRLPTARQMQQIERDFGRVAQEQKVSLQEAKSAVTTAQKIAKDIGLNAPTPSAVTEAETPDEAALKKAQQAAEKAANQQQQLAMDAAKRQNELDKARFEHLISMNESDFDHWKSLQDDKFNYEIAGMNSIEARQRKFQKDLQDIEIRRIETIRKAELETAKAVQESQAAARVSAAAGGGVTGLYQGSTGISSGAHFDIRRADRSRITEAEARALLDPSVSRQLQMTSGYGRRVPPVPGASSFHAGIDLAGPANTPLNLAPGYSLQGVGQEGGLGYTANVRGPQGEMYKVGHLQPPGASYTRQRRAEGAGGKQDVTQINATYKATEQLTNVQNAYDLALKQTATTIKSNVASIFPVAELQLETSLMKIRNQLQLQGMPAEYIQYKEQLFKAEYEAAEAVEKHKENISEFEQKRDAYTKKQQEGIKLTDKERQELDYLNRQIALNKEGMAALTEQQKAYNIAALESAIATMKQADALKAMEEVSGRINDAVEGVTGTYKGLFKEIAMGGDSVEALKKAQQALADQFLTMVFDMAMKPVEESMKNSLAKMFGVPTEKEKREESIKKMEEQLKQLQLIERNTAITAGQSPASGTTPAPTAPGQTTAAGATGGFLTGPAALQTLPFNGQTGGMLQTLPFNGESGFLSNLGINSEELSASITENANAFSEQLGKVDASVFDSAMALNEAGTELGPEGAAGKKWQDSLGKAVGGLGMAAGAVMGIVAGINQIKEGGTSNVLGGIGMIASMAGSLLGSFGGLFGGGAAGASSIVQGVDVPIAQMPPGMAFANGGIAFGGFRAFANGGVVSGPTLGLIGEGKYNEAVVPLPDGRSIPVQLGGKSARDLMGSNAPGMPASPSLNMKFETTKINGVEYVSREQLEQAMAETRRASIAGGARQGMSMTLDRIKQSPSTRSSIGIR